MNVFHFHHIGKREHQEDSFYIHPDGNLFIMCDGVGGAEGGKIASETVVRSIASNYSNVNGKFDDKKVEWLIRQATHDLRELSSHRDFSTDMATTLALLVFKGDTAFITHVGDSRVYYLRPEEQSWWVTKDHSLVQELLDAGVLNNEQEMRAHPMKSRITRAIQALPDREHEEVPIHIITSVEPGSIFILCTDGVLEHFTSETFADHFMQKDLSIEDKWNALKRICEKQSVDNNTCILIHSK